MPTRIAALILAAGGSRRFGSDKRLHRIGGEPMLARTVAVYRAAFDDVAVVVRPREPDIAALVDRAGGRIVEAADAHRGQSRSLAAGVAACRAAQGLVIGLADMPFVAASTLRALAAALAENPDRIVRPRHGGTPGNPIGFPPSAYPALLRQRGDRGARDLVASCGADFIDVDDAGVLADVDRPEDGL